MRRVLLLTATMLASLVDIGSAAACLRKPMSVETIVRGTEGRLRDSTAVFTGVVEQIITSDDGMTATATFRVLKAYKGAPAAAVEVKSATQSSYCAHGRFHLGATELMFTGTPEGGGLPYPRNWAYKGTDEYAAQVKYLDERWGWARDYLPNGKVLTALAAFAGLGLFGLFYAWLGRWPIPAGNLGRA